MNEALLVHDGLILPEVGPWAEDKHRKIGYYASVFSASMKQKWDCRVFIDLFAGAGKAKIKETGQIVPGSPLVALNIDVPFDRYVFCELNAEYASALQIRIHQHFPKRQAVVLNRDANLHIEEVLAAVPTFDRARKGLTFCFVDPFNTQNLTFSTIRRIASALYVDFVVLIPSFMDIKRNEHIYTRSDCTIVDNFLGTTAWRKEWDNKDTRFKDFGVFVADRFGHEMAKLKYHYDGPDDFETVRKGQDRSLYLYHLGFFSRNPLGVKFWRETRERTSAQSMLPF